jgi:hypothetical protein
VTPRLRAVLGMFRTAGAMQDHRGDRAQNQVYADLRTTMDDYREALRSAAVDRWGQAASQSGNEND